MKNISLRCGRYRNEANDYDSSGSEFHVEPSFLAQALH